MGAHLDATRGPLRRRGEGSPAGTTWRPVEVYATFVKLTGELEVRASERFSDAVRRAGDFLPLRDSRAEPLGVRYPVISRSESETTVARSAVVLVCPVDEVQDGGAGLRRERERRTAAINTVAFSLVADVHLAAGRSLRDHLERTPAGFLPVTNVSALWIAASSGETHSVQRPFALLSTAAILSFSVR